MDEIRLVMHKVPMRGRHLMRGKTWQAQHYKKKKEQEEWQWWIKKSIAGQRPAKPLSGVTVYVTIYRKSFDKDSDNLMFSLKPLLDALVAEGVLVDDSERHIRLEKPRQVKCIANPQTQVRIEIGGHNDGRVGSKKD